MVWAALGRFAVLVGLAVSIPTARVSLPWLVVAAFLLGVGQVFFDLAAQSVLPDFVSRDRRSLATAFYPVLNNRALASATDDSVG